MIYTATLESGVTIPLDPFVQELFCRSYISPTMVAPNGMKNLMAFVFTCRLHHVAPTRDLLRAVLTMKNVMKGNWMVTFTNRRGYTVCDGLPSNLHSYMDKYVAIRPKDGRMPFPWGFSVPEYPMAARPALSDNDQQWVDAVFKTNGPLARYRLRAGMLGEPWLRAVASATNFTTAGTFNFLLHFFVRHSLRLLFFSMT